MLAKLEWAWGACLLELEELGEVRRPEEAAG